MSHRERVKEREDLKERWCATLFRNIAARPPPREAGGGGGISWNNRLALVQHSYPHDIIDYSFNYASFWKDTLMSFSVTNSAIQRRNGADKLGVTEQHETE